MKVIRFRELFFVMAGVCLVFGTNSPAQESASSASVARSRAITAATVLNSASSGYGKAYNEPVRTFTPPDEIAVEEFVNYHRHRLPLPNQLEGLLFVSVVVFAARLDGLGRSCFFHRLFPYCLSNFRVRQTVTISECGKGLIPDTS